MTLKDRLIRYLKNNPQWHASGDLQRLVSEHTTYSPQNTGRRLRELVQEAKAEVEYKKGHAYYRAKRDMVEWFDSLK